MKVSCLTITRDRKEFIPWLVWNFQKQTHPNKELVVVDSSEESVKDLLPEDAQYIRATPGTNIPTKRNMAMQASTGELLTWMDDDDWQHPEKCAMLVESLGEHTITGSRFAHFVDLKQLRCQPFVSPIVLFTSLGIRRDHALQFPFPEHIHKASDTFWLNQLCRDQGISKQIKLLNRKDVVFWFCHHQNISNPANKKLFCQSLELLAEAVGEVLWPETWAQIMDLRTRLSFPTAPSWESYLTTQANNTRNESSASWDVSSTPVLPVYQSHHDTFPPLSTKNTQTWSRPFTPHASYLPILQGIPQDSVPSSYRQKIGVFVAPKDGALPLDTQSLVWGIKQAISMDISNSSYLSLFACPSWDRFVQEPERVWSSHALEQKLADCVEPGTLFSSWLRTLDTLIISGDFPTKAAQLARTMRVNVVFIPTLSSIQDTDEQNLQSWVKDITRSQAIVWTKTRNAAERLQTIGLTATMIPWSIPDSIPQQHRKRFTTQTTSSPVRFLLDASEQHHTDQQGILVALRAFAYAYQRDPVICLRVYTQTPLSDTIPQWERLVPGIPVETVWGSCNTEQHWEHYRWAHVLLYPTKWDEFPVALLRGLHASLPCVALDGWPMNELLEHEYNGLLASAQQCGHVGLLPYWECDVRTLAYSISRMAHESELRNRCSCPEPGAQLARQQYFIAQLRHQLLTKPTKMHTNSGYSSSQSMIVPVP